MERSAVSLPLHPVVTLWGVTETVPRTEAGAVFLFLPAYLWDNEPTLAFELAAAPGTSSQAASTATYPHEATQTGIDAYSQPSPE